MEGGQRVPAKRLRLQFSFSEIKTNPDETQRNLIALNGFALSSFYLEC